MLKYDIVKIDEIVDELLSKCDKPYNFKSADPSVNISKIIKALGLKGPRYVSKDKEFDFVNVNGTLSRGTLKGKHAGIRADGTILINKKDKGNKGQCRFNCAHEAAHIALGHYKLPSKEDIKAYQSYKKSSNRSKSNLLVAFAARSETKNKKISYNKNLKEEEADHLAVNLLVPLYRFQFWFDKTDTRIAKAFKVVENCIKKRRKEIKNEMNELDAAVIQEVIDPFKTDAA